MRCGITVSSVEVLEAACVNGADHMACIVIHHREGGVRGREAANSKLMGGMDVKVRVVWVKEDSNAGQESRVNGRGRRRVAATAKSRSGRRGGRRRRRSWDGPSGTLGRLGVDRAVSSRGGGPWWLLGVGRN